MLELFPGDLISEKEDNKEIARYLVISRVIQNQNAQYYYVEYNCIITYFNGKVYHRPRKGRNMVDNRHNQFEQQQGGLGSGGKKRTIME